MYNKKAWIWIVLISISFLVVLLLLFIITLFLLLPSFHHESSTIRNKFDHRLRRFDILTNKSTLGSVSLPKKMKPNEFISYKSSEGSSLFLISNFESKEYHCRGECFCETNEERRSIAVPHLLSRGLFTLLVATSTTYAMNLAKEELRNSCVEEFSEVCPEVAVQARVRDCSRWPDPIWYYDENFEAKEGKAETYICKGNCMETNWYLHHHDQLEVLQIRMKGDCHVINIAKCVENVKSIKQAKEKFFRAVLTIKCMRSSLIQFGIEKRMKPLCFAGSIWKKDSDFNPTIFCRKLF